MATHSRVLAWEIPWTEEPGGLYSPWGRKRVRHDSAAKQQTYIINLVISLLCQLKQLTRVTLRA